MDVGLEVRADCLAEFSGHRTKVFGPWTGVVVKISPVEGEFDFRTVWGAWLIMLPAPVRFFFVITSGLWEAEALIFPVVMVVFRFHALWYGGLVC